MAYFPRQGDIIVLNFSPTLGHEQRGRRPALVVSNNTFHKFTHGIAIVCPITNTHRNVPAHIMLDSKTSTTGFIMADQVKALDLTKRNASLIEIVSDDILSLVCETIADFVEFETRN